MVPVMLVQLANDVPGWQFRFSAIQVCINLNPSSVVEERT